MYIIYKYKASRYERVHKSDYQRSTRRVLEAKLVCSSELFVVPCNCVKWWTEKPLARDQYALIFSLYSLYRKRGKRSIDL